MIRDYITYKEASTIWWAIQWRVLIPIGLLALVINLQTPAIVGIIAVITLAIISIFITKTIIGKQIGTLRLVLLKSGPMTDKLPKIVSAATSNEAALIWLSLAWRALAIQLPIIITLWPLFLPNICILFVLEPIRSFWFDLCNASGGSMFDALKMANVKFGHGLTMWITLQVTWIPAIHNTIGRSFVSFSLVVEQIS